MASRLTPHQVDEIVALLRAGKRLHPVALQYGVAFSTIWSIKRRRLPQHCCRRLPNRLHAESFILKARRLWFDGMSASQIGDELGVTKNVIVGIAARNDFPPRPSPIKRAGCPSAT